MSPDRVRPSLWAKVMLMRIRQETWNDVERPKFVFLSTDASLQHGHDYQLTLEDSVDKSQAPMFFDDAFDIDLRNMGKHLHSTNLPVAVVGAGNASLAGKFEAVAESVKLDIGLRNMQRYGLSVIGFVSDYGTEAKFLEAGQGRARVGPVRFLN